MTIQPYPNWDIQTVIYAQSIFEGFVPFFKIISIIVSPPLMFIIALVLLLFDKKKGVQSLIFLAIITFLSIALKDILHHPRPYYASPYVTGFIIPLGYGMPSGHAMFGTFYLFLATLYRSKIMTLLTIIAFVLVCISRVVLGAHYVTQILVGTGIGITLILMIIASNKTLRTSSSLSFKGKIISFWLAMSIIVVITVFSYLQWGMFFEPLDEWQAMASQYTDKIIPSVNFLPTLASLLFCIGTLFALLLEKELLLFQLQSLRIVDILFMSFISGIYLLILVIICGIFYLISPIIGIGLVSFFLPIVGLFFLPLEASIIGMFLLEKPLSNRLERFSLFRFFRGLYVAK